MILNHPATCPGHRVTEILEIMDGRHESGGIWAGINVWTPTNKNYCSITAIVPCTSMYLMYLFNTLNWILNCIILHMLHSYLIPKLYYIFIIYLFVILSFYWYIALLFALLYVPVPFPANVAEEFLYTSQIYGTIKLETEKLETCCLMILIILMTMNGEASLKWIGCRKFMRNWSGSRNRDANSPQSHIFNKLLYVMAMGHLYGEQVGPVAWSSADGLWAGWDRVWDRFAVPAFRKWRCF